LLTQRIFAESAPFAGPNANPNPNPNVGVAVETNHRSLVVNPCPNPNPSPNPNPNVGVALSSMRGHSGAWPGGHVTALEQSQRQHCVAKGVAENTGRKKSPRTVHYILLTSHLQASILHWEAGLKPQYVGKVGIGDALNGLC